jgi:dihydrofolate reductase
MTGAFGPPCFVVTHRPGETLVKGPTTFTFVTDGVEYALAQARDAAGDRDVCVMGGAGLGQQVLAAGLVDELRIHVAPVLFGAGTRLFEDHGDAHVALERTSVVATPAATHLTFRVLR